MDWVARLDAEFEANMPRENSSGRTEYDAPKPLKPVYGV